MHYYINGETNYAYSFGKTSRRYLSTSLEALIGLMFSGKLIWLRRLSLAFSVAESKASDSVKIL